MDTAIGPRNCTNCWYCKSANPSVTGKPAIQAATAAPGCVFACKMLDGVAAWLINGVAAVFFNTLERCSCIYIGTIDDNDLDDDTDVPFIHNNNANLQLPKTEAEEEEEKEEEVPLKNIGINGNVNIDA